MTQFVACCDVISYMYYTLKANFIYIENDVEWIVQAFLDQQGHWNLWHKIKEAGASKGNRGDDIRIA